MGKQETSRGGTAGSNQRDLPRVDIGMPETKERQRHPRRWGKRGDDVDRQYFKEQNRQRGHFGIIFPCCLLLELWLDLHPGDAVAWRILNVVGPRAIRLRRHLVLNELYDWTGAGGIDSSSDGVRRSFTSAHHLALSNAVMLAVI